MLFNAHVIFSVNFNSYFTAKGDRIRVALCLFLGKQVYAACVCLP